MTINNFKYVTITYQRQSTTKREMQWNSIYSISIKYVPNNKYENIKYHWFENNLRWMKKKHNVGFICMFVVLVCVWRIFCNRNRRRDKKKLLFIWCETIVKKFVVSRFSITPTNNFSPIHVVFVLGRRYYIAGDNAWWNWTDNNQIRITIVDNFYYRHCFFVN